MSKNATFVTLILNIGPNSSHAYNRLYMYDRAILHMDLDSFFVSVEILKDSRLKGRPVLIGGTSSRGVVASCSYEARAFGVHSAMPVKQALYLCPGAIVLRGDMEQYSKYSKLVTDIIAEDAPLYEKSSIDEFYVDLTGMDKHFGCYQWSSELRQTIIKESGLPISFGLASNKLISKMSTNEAKPNGELQIEKGNEKDFIAPMLVKKIPGVGEKTFRKLCIMGVKYIKILSGIPLHLLEREFGAWGRKLHLNSHGIDNKPVVPYSEKKSISKERTFREDTLDIHRIKTLMVDMCDKLCFELRAKGKLTSCVTVKIRYADFQTCTRQLKIPYTAQDEVVIGHVKRLFDAVYQRRQLIRLVGVRLSGLVNGNYQIQLFDDTVEKIALLRELDHIRRRFGTNAINRASVLQEDTRALERFFMSK